MHQKPSGLSDPPDHLAVLGGWGPQEGRERERKKGRERKGEKERERKKGRERKGGEGEGKGNEGGVHPPNVH